MLLKLSTALILLFIVSFLKINLNSNEFSFAKAEKNNRYIIVKISSN
jgi:hypothetical protein